VRRDLPVPATALAISAHPDDAELGAGATLAKWAAAGCAVHLLVCTDGSKGSWDAGTDRSALVATRQAEQRAAWLALGADGTVSFLGRVDGELDSDLATRAAVAGAIRQTRPEVVLGHDPWRRYRLHPDHRHAGRLAVEGIVAARDPLFDDDRGLDPWRPSTLLLWEADMVDHTEDVTGFVEPKLQALAAHASQYRSTMAIGAEQDDAAHGDQQAGFAQRVHDRLAEFGRRIGVRAGEGFKLLDDL
jgi:LmbE family N-acetylglucosaminyl deacetylase